MSNVEKLPIQIDHKWLSQEAMDLFNTLKNCRDAAVMKMHHQLGDVQPIMPEKITAAELARMPRQITDPQQRNEIAQAWEPIISDYESKMADVIKKYSAPMTKMIDKPADWDTKTTPDDEATTD